MAKKYILLTLALLPMLGIAACNTVEGAGQDIESAGESIQDASQDARH